jgi:hypothetical protein
VLWSRHLVRRLRLNPKQRRHCRSPRAVDCNSGPRYHW